MNGLGGALSSGGAGLSGLENASGHVVAVGDSSTLGVSSSRDFERGGVRGSLLGGIGRLGSVSDLDAAG